MIYRLLGGVSLVIGGVFALVTLLVLLPFLNNFNTSLLVLAAIFGILAYVFLAIGWQLVHPPRARQTAEPSNPERGEREQGQEPDDETPRAAPPAAAPNPTAAPPESQPGPLSEPSNGRGGHRTVPPGLQKSGSPVHRDC